MDINCTIGVKNFKYAAMLSLFRGALQGNQAGRDFQNVQSLILCILIKFLLNCSWLRSSLFGVQGQTNLGDFSKVSNCKNQL